VAIIQLLELCWLYKCTSPFRNFANIVYYLLITCFKSTCYMNILFSVVSETSLKMIPQIFFLRSLVLWGVGLILGVYCEEGVCRNRSLGLTTKVRACKGAGQERSLVVTSHAPESVRDYEGMNLHTPNWVPILGVGVSMDSWIFKEQLQRSKNLDWGVIYVIGKLLERRCLKWALMTHLDIWNTSYGQ
jgi:hypothetical protein